MPNLSVFEFQSHAVRTIIDERGDVLFVGKDVCDVLQIGNSRMAMARLDEDEKGVSSIDTLAARKRWLSSTNPACTA